MEELNTPSYHEYWDGKKDGAPAKPRIGVARLSVEQTEALCNRCLEMFAEGKKLRRVAEELGYWDNSIKTLIENRMNADPEFAQRVEDANMSSLQTVGKFAVPREWVKGQKSFRIDEAARRRGPRLWSRLMTLTRSNDDRVKLKAIMEGLAYAYGRPIQRNELTGADGGDIGVRSKTDLSGLSSEEQRALGELLRKAHASGKDTEGS